MNAPVRHGDLLSVDEVIGNQSKAEKRKAYLAKYRADNAEKAKAYGAKWRTENADRVKKYLAENANKIRDRKAEYRRQNAEKEKASRAAYLARNADRVRLVAAKYKKENADRLRDYRIRRRAENVETLRLKDRAHAHNRRARKVENGGVLSIGLAETLFKLQRGRCACCGAPLGKKYHMDHIIPLALGGANEDINMQLLTAKCNLQKHMKHPVKFMQERGFLL